jgi:2'-5' RNA ligase
MEAVRTFICLQLPLFARDRLASIQQRLRESETQVNWVRPQNIHLTLKFLGLVPAEGLQDVVEAVQRAAVPGPSIPLELNVLGCFPNRRAPRVVWAGLKRFPEELRVLQQRVEEELVAIGFPAESRPFSPHFTLGRVRTERNIRKLVAAMQAERLEPLRFEVAEVVVMASRLHPSGGLYTPISRIPQPCREK